MTSRERLIAAARREQVDTIPVSPRLGYASKIHFGESDVFADLRLKQVYDFDPHFIIPANHYPFFDAFATFRDRPEVQVEIHISKGDRTRTVKKRYVTPEGALTEEFMVPTPGYAEFGESPNPIHTEYLVKEIKINNT